MREAMSFGRPGISVRVRVWVEEEDEAEDICRTIFDS